MPRPRNAAPVYRLHKPTGQAVCTVRLADGRYRDLYLGVHLSPASRAEFQRVVALVIANGGVYPADVPDLTVNEGLVRYAKFITGYYVDPTGRPTGTADDIKITLGYLKRLFGPEPLAEFSPPKLKAVRGAMIADGRVRVQVNKRVSQVRQFFKWCVEEQLVPSAVLEGLRAVRPLAPGRSGVKEGKPVMPADAAAVAKALPLMPPAVRAVADLLRLSGARPTEVLAARPPDIDRTAAVWVLTPARHKGSWRRKPRAVYLGPEAQRVLAPWLLGVAPDEFIFSPARSEAERNARRSDERATPLWPSHQNRNEKKRKGGRRALPPGGRYDARSFAKAVRRACERAGVKPFTPYQLRHLKAVELRERYGLEYVRAVLGHSFKAMSDHYSKAADEALASRAAAECG